MKKMMKLFYFLIAVSSMTMIQSCKDDPEPVPVPPTVTAPTGVVAVQIGGSAEVTFTFKAPEGFASAAVSATGGTATVTTPPAASSTEGSIVVTFTADNTSGAGAVTLTLTDSKAQTATANGVINKTISAPPTIALSETSSSGNPGSNVMVTATVTAANGAKSISYTTTGGLVGSPASPITLSGTTQLLTFTIPASAALGSSMTAVITATDNQNLNSTPQTFTVVATTNELTGTMTANMTLHKDVPYLIKGQFIVPSGMTLTVEEGALVKGDKATKGVLIVKQGGTITAIGSETNPIVFTSSQGVGERDRGDWGGIVILGDAFVNQTAKPAVEGLTAPANDADFFKYGTVSTSDASVGVNDQNSGTLKYVRIEYAGIELIPNSETNSLTMAAVGSGTTIEYVQASYGGDDGFEWFGGTVSAKHLISLATWDDDFDTDFGWRGNVQWAVAVRAPFVADQSGSTSFESDSQGNGNAIGTICTDTDRTGCTQGVFSNVTVLGPRDFNNGTGSGTSSRSISANYTRAMHIRRRTAISIFNSFISGYGAASGIQGLEMDDAGTIANYTAGAGVLANNVLMFPDATANAEYGSNVGGAATTSVKDFWEAGAANIVVKPTGGAPWSPNPGAPAGSINPYTDFGITSSLFFGSSTSANYPSNPNFAVTAGSLLDQTPGTLFASGKLGSFFDKTLTYKGAFGATDWTDGWSEFQPLNKTY